jgi:hypothetical protein
MMICCLSRAANFLFELDSIDLTSPVAPSLEGDNTFGRSHDELVQATRSAKLRIGGDFAPS